MNNTQKGRFGEKIAQDYLLKLGYKIIDKNWHYSKNAEVDIIAEDKDIIVFIEVKTRKTLDFGHPFEAINQNKIRKIRTAILGYMKTTTKKYKSYRFDAIAIIGFDNPSVEHIKDIGQY